MLDTLELMLDFLKIYEGNKDDIEGYICWSDPIEKCLTKECIYSLNKLSDKHSYELYDFFSNYCENLHDSIEVINKILYESDYGGDIILKNLYL